MGVEFLYEPYIGYKLIIPFYRVKHRNSFRNKHEFEVSDKDWEFSVEVTIFMLNGRYEAKVKIPLSDKYVYCSLGHLSTVMKTLEAVAVV